MSRPVWVFMAGLLGLHGWPAQAQMQTQMQTQMQMQMQTQAHAQPNVQANVQVQTQTQAQAQAQAQVAPAPPAATLLQALPVPTTAADGTKPRELSGLAWSPDGQTLAAVSDRGRLFHWQVRWAQGLIDSLAPVRVNTLVHEGRVLNAEALAWQALPVPTLLVADEAAPQVWPVSPDGVLGLGQALPAPLRDSQARRGANNGVEGLAWHPAHGLLAAPQRPLAGLPEDVHRIYAGSGAHWDLSAVVPRSNIKALDVLPDGQLLVLERYKAGHEHRHVLRRLDLARCGGAQRCAPPAWAVPLPAAAAAPASVNLEGLACLDSRRCLLVSDDGGRPGTGWFLLLALP